MMNLMSSNCGISKNSVVSKTSATSALVLTFALFCAQTYIPEISQKFKTGKIEPPAWAPDSVPEPVLPTTGVERVSPRSVCGEVALEVTASGGIGVGGLPLNEDCVEIDNVLADTHGKEGDRKFAGELMEKHRARWQQKGRQSHEPIKKEVLTHVKEQESHQAHQELLKLVAQRRGVSSHSARHDFNVFSVLLAPFFVLGALVFYTDVHEASSEAIESEAQDVPMKEPQQDQVQQEEDEEKEKEEEQQDKAVSALVTDIAAEDPQQFVECFALEEDDFPESTELANSYEIDWARLEPEPKVTSRALWPCSPSNLHGLMHAAIVMAVIVVLASLTLQLRKAVGAQSEQQVPSFYNGRMALAAKHQSSQLSNGVAASILSILAVLGGVFFSFDVQDALEEEATKPCRDEPSRETTRDEGDDSADEQSEAQSPALWPCTVFQLRGFMHSVIVIFGVVGLAVATSQFRAVLASQQLKMEGLPSDNELLALSAKQQDYQLPNSAIALILSMFTMLGGVIFRFDVQDALEQKASEFCSDEVSKEVPKDKGNEQQSEAQSPALWPCTLFQLRGLMHSAIVVLGVVGLAVVTSQLRAAMASQGESTKVEVLTIDEELIALSAKHQGSQLSNGATVLILSIFALLGGVVFSFDVQDEDEASESCADEPSKEVAKDDGDEQQPEVQSPALWPCTLFHMQGFIRSAIIVCGVVGLAVVTSQLRAAMASQGEQLKMEVMTIDEELMALSAKHQGSQLSNIVTVLILSIFALLGVVVFSFDVQDEDEASESRADEPSKENAKDEGDEQHPKVQSTALWPCTLFHMQGFMRSAITVCGVVGLAVVTSQLRAAMASQGEQMKVEVLTIDEELMALSAKHQGSQLSNSVTVLILSIFALLGGVVFSFDVQDEDEASESHADEPSKEVTKDEGDEQQPEVQSPALWPCTLFHMQGFIRSAIIVCGVLGLAVVTSQLRAAMASQGEQMKVEVQTIDEELNALSAKHQGPQLSNSVTGLILSIFALLGGVVFSFDVQDEDEASESRAHEPSKEVAKDEGDEQQPEVQSPALWPCTLFHMQGFMRSAIIVCGVVGLAVVTSQLRAAMASQGEQLKMEVVTIDEFDEELMALSAKHQGSQLSNSVTVLILSIFALLGGVVFSFDVQDEDEASESCADEPPKEVTKDEGDEQQPEVQSPALWPCTLFQLRGFMHSVIVVICVVSLAAATSQLRGVLTSQSEQLKMEGQTADDELMALAAKHQDYFLSAGMTSLILGTIAMLGGVFFCSDVEEAFEEEVQYCERYPEGSSLR